MVQSEVSMSVPALATGALSCIVAVTETESPALLTRPLLTTRVAM